MGSLARRLILGNQYSCSNVNIMSIIYTKDKWLV